MIIVAGHITVDAEQREAHMTDSARIVEEARRAEGCLDFAMSADLVDPGRLNLFERWESQEALNAYRKRARRGKHRAEMLSVSVAEYEIAEERRLF